MLELLFRGRLGAERKKPNPSCLRLHEMKNCLFNGLFLVSMGTNQYKSELLFFFHGGVKDLVVGDAVSFPINLTEAEIKLMGMTKWKRLVPVSSRIK